MYYNCPDGPINERLKLEQLFHNKLLDKLEALTLPGYSFTPPVQKEIFNPLFIEDPVLMTSFVEYLCREQAELNKNKTKQDQSDSQLALFNNVIEVCNQITS